MTKFSNLKKGEILSEAQFYVVNKIVGNEAELVTEGGESIVVDKAYIDGLLTSANQYTSEKTLTMTEAAALFLSSANTAITVNFNKKVKQDDVNKEIDAEVDKLAQKGTAVITEVKKALKAAAKRSMEGEERTMRGYHKGELGDLGRVNFIDLEIPKGKHNIRQVDTRTINWLIIKDVKYNVK